MTFATQLTLFRAKNNLTQEQTAEILGISPGMVYRYEKSLNEPSRKNKILFDELMERHEKGENDDMDEIKGYKRLAGEFLKLVVKDYKKAQDDERLQIMQELKKGNYDIYLELLGIRREAFEYQLRQLEK